MKHTDGVIEVASVSWDKLKLAKAVGVVLGAAALCGSMAYLLDSDPEYQYRKNFTDEGKCLDTTPYDEDNGASVDTTTLQSDDMIQGEGDVIRVIPRDANNQDPSVLYITETDKGWYGFGDHQTGAFLVKMHCENIPNGY